MPRQLLCLLPLIVCLRAVAADITVVVDFDGPYSNRSVQQMKRETEEIFKTAGVHLDWRMRNEVGLGSYENLVVVHFKGKCMLEPIPMLYDERGPFAFAYNSDGDVLPFSEVECNHLTASVHSAMWGDDFARPDYLLGRALGRVLAHELVHILTRSAMHGNDGVTQATFSGRELIGAPLRLSRADVARLHRAFGDVGHASACPGEPGSPATARVSAPANGSTCATLGGK
jgi:hypothetical protein